MKKTIMLLSVLALLAGGCKQATKEKGVLETETADNAQSETIAMPSQNYVGLWHTADNPPDDLTILEIGNDIIKFEFGIFRTLVTEGTAKIENNKIVFVTDHFSGTLEFNENGILLSVDKTEFEYIKAGRTFNFPVKIASAQQKVQSARKIKHLAIEPVGYTVFFDDGTAYDCKRCDIPENLEDFANLEPNTAYEEFPDHLRYGKYRKEDASFYASEGTLTEGFILSCWKIINYQKIISIYQVIDFQIDNSKIPANEIQEITENCLITMRLDGKDYSDKELEKLIEIADDFGYYMNELKEWCEENGGIKTVYPSKRYLSFALENGNRIIVDVKKFSLERSHGALFYAKDFLPFIININPGDQIQQLQEIEMKLRELKK